MAGHSYGTVAFEVAFGPINDAFSRAIQHTTRRLNPTPGVFPIPSTSHYTPVLESDAKTVPSVMRVFDHGNSFSATPNISTLVRPHLSRSFSLIPFTRYKLTNAGADNSSGKSELPNGQTVQTLMYAAEGKLHFIFVLLDAILSSAFDDRCVSLS